MPTPATQRQHDGAFFRAALAPTLVVLAGYLLVTFVTLRAFDFNPSGPIRIGDLLPAQRFWSETTMVQGGVGYDGQWFFNLAHDPFLRASDPEAFLDAPGRDDDVAVGDVATDDGFGRGALGKGWLAGGGKACHQRKRRNQSGAIHVSPMGFVFWIGSVHAAKRYPRDPVKI